MLVICPLQSVIIDDEIAEARRMGMSAASIADISDGESSSASFKLLFGVWLSRKKIWTSLSLRHKLKLSEYIASIPSASVRR